MRVLHVAALLVLFLLGFLLGILGMAYVVDGPEALANVVLALRDLL